MIVSMKTEIDLQRLIGVIRRQIWLILVIAGGLALAATVIVYSLEPRFTASTMLFVDTSSKDIMRSDDRSQAGSTDNARVESEVAIIASNGVLLDVINAQNLLADDEFGIKVGAMTRLMEKFGLDTGSAPNPAEAISETLASFSKSTRVDRKGLTYVISVSVTSNNKEKAARLANALANAYIRRQVESKISAMVASRDILEKRVETARTSIASSEKGVSDFILANIESLQQNGASNVSALYNELEGIAAERKGSLSRIETIDKTLKSNDLSTLVQNLESQAANEYMRQRQALVSQIASADVRSAPNLRAELAKLETAISEEGQRRLGTLRSELQAADAKEATVRSNLTNAVLNSNLPSETLTEVYSLRQNAQIARREFDDLSMRLQRLDTQAALQVADSRVVSVALPPTDPSYPKKQVVVPVAALAALVLGIGVAFAREHFIGGFTNEEQVEAVLRIPIAAISPREHEDADHKGGEPSTSISDTVVRAPLSLFAESIRRIRVAVDLHRYKSQSSKDIESGANGTVIMVSSALPNEGKSTMALSIARTYALSGKRTLIIDCDLRKPSLHRHLNADPSSVLTDFLRNSDTGAPLPKLSILDPKSGLTAILGGARSNVPTDQLLIGPEMQKLIQTARRSFDYIILDTSPVEPVVDGLYLAKHADVIAFVVQWAVTSQVSAKRAVKALQESVREGTPILAILNQQERTKLLGYGTYSGYHVE